MAKRALGSDPRLVGDPVDVTTGEVRDVATDFRLAGPRPLAWNRHYASLRLHEDRGLGLGHRHSFDWALRKDVDGLRVETPDDPIRFPRDSSSTRGWVLTRISTDAFLLKRDGEPTREFVLDAAGAEYRLRRIVHADGSETTLAYRGTELSSVANPRTGTLSFRWTGGLLRSVTATGSFGSFTPIAYEYDESTRTLVGGRDAYGHRFAWEYDAGGRVVRRTDRAGYAFVYTYDAHGRCVRVAGEDDVDAVLLEYQPSGRETKVIHEANGATWWYRYGSDRALIEIENPYGACRQFVHAHGAADASGGPPAHRVAHTILQHEHGTDAATTFEPPTADALRRLLPDTVATALVPAEFTGVVRPVHDAQGLLLREDREFPGSDYAQSRRYAYDANGNTASITDLGGGRWSFARTSWNQPSAMRDPLGGETRLAYNLRDRVERVVDPGGCETLYSWDLCDRLEEVQRHAKVRERYVYDGAGALVRKEGADGRALVDYERGPGGALVSRVGWDGVTESFERDAEGRIVVTTTQDNLTAPQTTRRAYDGPRRVLEERDGSGFEHTYGSAGRRTAFRLRGSTRFVVEFRVDADGGVEIEDPTGSVHRSRVLGSGVSHREFANGTWEVSQYDATGHCIAKVTNGAAGAWRRRFVRNGDGDLEYREDDRRGRTDFAYDAARRLVEVRAGDRVDAYEHDAAGNVVHKPGLREWAPVLEGPPDLRDSRRLSLSSGNQIRRANSDRFHYDAEDHLSGREGDWGELVYVRDALGRLKKVFYKSRRSGAIKLRWEAEYDALGRRTHKRRFRKGGREEAWEFFWDGDRLGAETLPDGRLRIYVYGSEGALVPMLALEYASVEDAPDKGRVFALQADHRGAIERVEDESGQVVWEATIHPYGEAEVDARETFYMPFRLVGQYADPGLNLCCTRYRYWSPELARFLESDPVGLAGGLNVYAWRGSPLRVADPLGLGCASSDPSAPSIREGEVDAELPYRWPVSSRSSG